MKATVQPVPWSFGQNAATRFCLRANRFGFHPMAQWGRIAGSGRMPAHIENRLNRRVLS